MRVTRSRGGGIGMTPRDRPPTPRAGGAASMIRTPSPNRGQEGQQLGNLPLPFQAGMNRYMERPNLTLQLHQSKKQSNPRLTNRNREIQEMTVDNLLQTNPDLQHPIGRDLLLHPTSKKPIIITKNLYTAIYL